MRETTGQVGLASGLHKFAAMRGSPIAISAVAWARFGCSPHTIVPETGAGHAPPVAALRAPPDRHRGTQGTLAERPPAYGSPFERTATRTAIRQIELPAQRPGELNHALQRIDYFGAHNG